MTQTTLADEHRCWQCGYNVRGLAVSGQCPECGETIDTTREWSGVLPARVIIATTATICIGFLCLAVLLLDVVVAATSYWPFTLVVALIGALIALPIARRTQQRSPLIALYCLALLLFLLQFVALTPRKPYVKYYRGIEVGMTRQEVIDRLDRMFPNRALDGGPTMTRADANRISMILGPQNGSYNAELIVVTFANDRVVSKLYSPD